VAPFAFYLRLASPLRQQAGALETDPGRSTAVKIVDGGNIAPDNIDPVDGNSAFDLRLGLLWSAGGGIHLLRESRAQHRKCEETNGS
jgi:hypothetical protein